MAVLHPRIAAVALWHPLHSHRRAADLLEPHAARHFRGDRGGVEHQPRDDRQGAVRADALAATLLLVVLHRLLAMATVHSNLLARFIKGRPVELVRDGKIDRAALHSNHLSEDDLIEGLRMEQTPRVEDVALATFERGGKISVVPKSKAREA